MEPVHTQQNKTIRAQVFTVPNLLSFIRLCLIPVIVWLYCVKEKPVWTAAVLVLSGITDMVDGYIARHFNMISDLGKALDPVADKLTQLAMLCCLVSRFPMMGLPFGLLLVKEAVTGIMSLIVIRKSKQVQGADWHGKVTTALLYAMLLLHAVWFNIPPAVSNTAIGICVGMMLLSFVLYMIRNTNALRSDEGGACV